MCRSGETQRMVIDPSKKQPRLLEPVPFTRRRTRDTHLHREHSRPGSTRPTKTSSI